MLITNYITSAWRNILRHKLFSFINILGLAIGLAAVMLIALYVRYEMSYDNFWKNADNIYRLNSTFTVPGRNQIEFNFVPGPVSKSLKQDFPQINHAARVAPWGGKMSNGNKEFVERITLVDPEITEIFDFLVIEGTLENAFNDPGNIVLTQTTAVKYFGSTSPIGKTISFSTDIFAKEYKIVAVIKDMNQNTQIPYYSMIKIVEEDFTELNFYFKGWWSVNYMTYYSVIQGNDYREIDNQLPAFINRHFPPWTASEPDTVRSDYITLYSLNLKDLHLHSKSTQGYLPYGDLDTLIIFSIVAIFIMTIASINFMNLSTARATERAKEVSLRKVMGANKSHLMRQFIGESVILTMIGLFIALCIVEAILPSFNEFLSKEIPFDYTSTDILQIIILTITIGFLGGVYPAFILSSYHPAEVLKSNKSSESTKSLKLRTFLVIIQFSVSITLLVSTGIVYRQIAYITDRDIGFNQENLLNIDKYFGGDATQKLSVLNQEIKRISGVTATTWSNFLPMTNQRQTVDINTNDTAGSKSIPLNWRSVGYDYFKTYEALPLAGREYDINRNDIGPTDHDIKDGNGYTQTIIVNEAAARRLGFSSPTQALDKTIYQSYTFEETRITRSYNIIGVVPNINFENLKFEVPAEIYFLNDQISDSISVRYEGDKEAIIEKITTLWQQQIPDRPVRIVEVEQAVIEQYKLEHDQMILFAVFSALAIFIACLGLFGLASFTAERRTKEIGIRKVFGAEVWQIVKLLVWQFSKPVIIANIIAWPLSFYAMSRWLESFVYRIDNIIIIAMCLVAGLTALLIAWATVAGNSYAVARANPIKALRYE